MDNVVEISIPDEATKYILFQRTFYQLLWSNYLLRALRKVLRRILPISYNHNYIYNHIVALDSVLFQRRIKRLYRKDIDNEYRGIKQFLPSEASAILDIGCGVAGIDVLLYKHYSNSGLNIFLLDKTQEDKIIHYGLKQEGSFYNSLPLAKLLLTKNGITPENIYLQEVTPDCRIHFKSTFDLVISLLSWGHHYPVFTYLDEVYSKLNPGGILIMDVRKESDGLDELEEKFHNIQVISETDRSVRIATRKQ